MIMEESGNKKLFKRDMSILWWTKRWSYIRFILRELTSVAVAFFSIEMIFLVLSISNGAEAYLAFVATLTKPIFVILNIIAFIGLIFHSSTWFDLAPKAMVVKVGMATISRLAPRKVGCLDEEPRDGSAGP